MTFPPATPEEAAVSASVKRFPLLPRTSLLPQEPTNPKATSEQ